MSPAAAQPVVALLAEPPAAAAIFAHTRDTLATFAVPFTQTTLADRDALTATIAAAASAGAQIFIVADTAPAPLSAAVAALTDRPVLAVPLESPTATPLEALQASTAATAPVGALAIGKPGAINAALLAVAILSNADPALRARLHRFRADQTAKVLADPL